MTTVPFSMRIDEELKGWLENEAKRQDRSATFLAKQAIEELKRQSESKHQMYREAVALANEGAFVSEEKMTTWFESVGTGNELPEPIQDIDFDRP